MIKINLNEMKRALSRKEMKRIIAGGSLDFFPNGSCCITFDSPCNGRGVGQQMCINIFTEPSVLGCSYSSACTSTNNFCDGTGCGAT